MGYCAQETGLANATGAGDQYLSPSALAWSFVRADNVHSARSLLDLSQQQFRCLATLIGERLDAAGRKGRHGLEQIRQALRCAGVELRDGASCETRDLAVDAGDLFVVAFLKEKHRYAQLGGFCVEIP